MDNRTKIKDSFLLSVNRFHIETQLVNVFHPALKQTKVLTVSGERANRCLLTIYRELR